MKYRRISVIIFATLLSAQLVGCQAAKQKPTPMPPIMPPPAAMTPQEINDNPGSLFDDATAGRLFDDNRARRVGDIVLVNIVETSKATNKANTKTEKEGTSKFGVTNFLGNSHMPLLAGAVGTTPLIQSSSVNDFEGKAETTRENSFTATIACRVVRAMPGGVLEVEGVRETRVNDETQYMVITGMVRSRDIGSDNSISSNQLANSRVAYYGEGTVADKQKPGWLLRFMDHVWPF